VGHNDNVKPNSKADIPLMNDGAKLPLQPVSLDSALQSSTGTKADSGRSFSVLKHPNG